MKIFLNQLRTITVTNNFILIRTLLKFTKTVKYQIKVSVSSQLFADSEIQVSDNFFDSQNVNQAEEIELNQVLRSNAQSYRKPQNKNHKNKKEAQCINSDSDSEIELIQNRQKKIYNKLNKRGKYQRYSLQLKQKAVQHVQNGQDIKKVSQELQIPLKNLLRWIDIGPERKKGGGRGILDPIMENKLYMWYCEQQKQNIEVTENDLKWKSKELINYKYKSSFKASKGWLVKFCIRNNIKIVNKDFYGRIRDHIFDNYSQEDQKVIIPEDKIKIEESISEIEQEVKFEDDSSDILSFLFD